MNWVEIGAIAGIVGIVLTVMGWIGKGVWEIAKTFEGMRHSLHTIATNDLPHIYEELKSLREAQTHGQDPASVRRGDREHSGGVGHYPAIDRSGFRKPER